MRTFKMYSQKKKKRSTLSKFQIMQYTIINCSHYAVYYIPHALFIL